MLLRDRRPVRPPDAQIHDLGEEFLVYSPATDRVHMLNATAKEIFLMCDGSRTVEALLEAVMVTYDADAETAGRDVEEIVQRLLDEGLLTLS